MGSVRGHVTYFLNFGTPSISRELFKLETSDLARILNMRCTNEKYSKVGQMGSEMGHLTYFYYFGTPSISRERFKLETSDLAQIFNVRGTNDKNTN